MVTKELVCKGFIGAVCEDASRVGSIISAQLRQQGIASTLENAACRDVFAAEWFFARLVWLEVQAATVRDLEMRTVFLKELDASINELSAVIPDMRQRRADYYMMALMHAEGELDSLGLPHGPGPFIADRYENYVGTIQRDRDEALTESPRVGHEESMLIMILGDQICWRLEAGLNEAFAAVLRD